MDGFRRARAGLVVLLTIVACGACAGSRPRPLAPADTPPSPPGAAPARAPTEQDLLEEMQPDRPDVTNGTHIVPKGLLQLESGGRWSRVGALHHQVGTPLSFRAGAFEWLEVRAETDGLSIDSTAGHTVATFGGVQLGAKVRLFAGAGWPPELALQPEVNLPVGTEVGTDYGLKLLASADLTENGHVDINYGLAAIRSNGPTFVQHLASVSASYQLGDHLSPYAEGYWFSKDQSGGGSVFSVDTGAIYTLTARWALDGGIDVGVARSLGRPTLFAGLSVVLGEISGGHGVHQRIREAAVRRIAREGR